MMPELGVNVDHVATLREARGGMDTDPVEAALICETAGCNSIVAHLREDRRHIKDRDIHELRKRIRTRLNLEMYIDPEIVQIALEVGPEQATLVPERRQELTTEGGLSVIKYKKRLNRLGQSFKKKGIELSIFIDPDKNEIRAVKDIGVDIIEIHTGKYSLAKDKKAIEREYKKIKDAADYALSLGLIVNAGHGLNYENVRRIAAISGINELNIGHSIISQAVFTGLHKAVRDMKSLVSV